MGTPVIVAGLLLVVMPRPGANSGGRVINTRRLRYVLALCGAATFASSDVISRHVVSDIAAPLVSAGLALAVGGAILTAILHRQVARSTQTLPRNYFLICGPAGLF